MLRGSSQDEFRVQLFGDDDRFMANQQRAEAQLAQSSLVAGSSSALDRKEFSRLQARSAPIQHARTLSQLLLRSSICFFNGTQVFRKRKLRARRDAG